MHLKAAEVNFLARMLRVGVAVTVAVGVTGSVGFAVAVRPNQVVPGRYFLSVTVRLPRVSCATYRSYIHSYSTR